MEKTPSERKEIALKRIATHERVYCGQKYVFVDNKQKSTNVIFTGAGQKYYMMISWFGEDKTHNYLYLNHNPYNETTEKIIANCQSVSYNMIGISYGAAAAIYYSTKFPTNTVVSIDPEPLGHRFSGKEFWDFFSASKSVFFFHFSAHPSDVANYKKIIAHIDKTKLMYFVKCSRSPVHSANIPNEYTIMEYIRFVERLIDESGECGILMKETKMSQLGMEFLPWT